ncbi:MerR family DNA-binding transcriptional regulator [Leptospira venezuelensis]|uniref:MerR family DNA-binding transcriptional regulator n=1 Tax=Leptospira venezuelensis TaxID=1958811 RepID=UPI000A39D3A5
MSKFLSISEISEITDFSPYTLRYYEKIGILRKPERIRYSFKNKLGNPECHLSNLTFL